MVEIKIKCKECNEFFIIEVNEADYFNWITSNDVSKLKLDIDDQVSFITKKCKYCRRKL